MSLHASVGALPDFLTPEQCAQYNKEHAGVAASPQEPTIFFTGKPYVDGLGYVFKYRNYNPELCRWQSADPSGFPDGANNQIYAPCPTSGVDPNGLYRVVLKNGSSKNTSNFVAAGIPIIDYNEVTVNADLALINGQSSAGFVITGTVTTDTYLAISPFPFVGFEGGSLSGQITANKDGTINVYFPDGPNLSVSEGFAQLAMSVSNTISPDGKTATVDISVGGANTNSSSVGLTVGGVSVTGSPGGAAFASSFEVQYTVLE